MIRKKIAMTLRAEAPPPGAPPGARAGDSAAAEAGRVLELRWPMLGGFLSALFARDISDAAGAGAGASAGAGAAFAFGYEEVYGGVADVLSQPRLAAALYARVRASCAERAEALLERVERSYSAMGGLDDDSALLRAAQAAWGAHSTEMALVRAVFTPLDRVGASSSASAGASGVGGAGSTGNSATPAPRPLLEMGIDVLRRALERRGALLQRLVRALVGVVRRERCGETIDRAVAASVVRMLAKLGLYAREAEPKLVRDCSDFYRSEGLARIGSTDGGDVAPFLHFVMTSLSDESARGTYLAPSSLRPFERAVDTHLVAAHLAAIVERGFGPLMEQARATELALVFRVSGRVGRQALVREAFGTYCKAKARAIVGDKDDDEKDKLLVASLVAFRDEMTELAQAAFWSAADAFAASLKSAIETSVNTRENKPAELVARYLDGRLRSGAKGVGSEDAMERELDKVMLLFKSIHGKDVFEAFYKKDLAKRLLLDRSASMDLEKSVVSKLKSECGSQFTGKLEGMFRDIEVARELNGQFVASKHSNGGRELGLEANVTVLTSAHWPSYPLTPAKLPPQLARAAKAFEAFYAHKFSSNRVLQWQHSLGRCLLRATFPKRRVELEVSVVQAIVLLLFNAPDSNAAQAQALSSPSLPSSPSAAAADAVAMSPGAGASSAPPESPIGYLRLKEDSGLDDVELRRTLQSLSLGQHRVLRKDKAGREVEDSDSFRFNAAFESNQVRIKINQIQMKETKQEIDATNERVLQDRQFVVDAAIVRILKSRKTIARQVLMSELFAQLRFAITSDAVGKRIQSLIERDYMEVDDKDPTKLNYLA